MTILAYFRHGDTLETVSIVTEAPEDGTEDELNAFWFNEYGNTPYATIKIFEDVGSWPTDRELVQR